MPLSSEMIKQTTRILLRTITAIASVEKAQTVGAYLVSAADDLLDRQMAAFTCAGFQRY